MFFMLLSAVIGTLLIAFAFSFDNSKGSRFSNPFVNMIMFISALFYLLAFVQLFTIIEAPRQFILLVARFMYVLMAWVSTGLCRIAITYESDKPHPVLNVTRWIFNLAAFAVIFIVNGGFRDLIIEPDSYYKIYSGYAFSGGLAQLLPFTWYTLYCVVFIIVLPFISSLIILIRAENAKSKLLRQNLHTIALGFLSMWVVYAVLQLGNRFQPMFSSLIMLSYVPAIIIFSKAFDTMEVWGKRLIGRTILRMTLIYLLPAAIEGLVYLLARHLFPVGSAKYYWIIFAGTVLVVLLWVFMGRHFLKADKLRGSKYGEPFENAISKIAYDGNPKGIIDILTNCFKKYVDSSTFTLAIDAGTGFLESVFTDEENKIMIPIDDPSFDVLLNQKHPIVFREYAQKDYSVVSVREQLVQLLDSTKSDAFIVLNEGRHVLGIMFLGPKNSGNRYTPYDYEVFTKMYSNFFVNVYYMKNIMNESVVGTVNREIRMSSQIITSIQENMDYITNPKIDCGYRMVPAHNIGGEFIDLIRLNNERHMFIIGSLNGKGIAASMSMVILKSVIRTDLAETSDFKILVQKINNFIRTSLPKGTFFAGVLSMLDFSTDTMYYINCGCPALFMYNHIYNNVIEIQGEGHVLGFKKDISNLVRVKKVKLSEGDIILACTDGLIEEKSLRGESYGKTRVQSQIMENASFPADKMAQFTYDGLVQFTSRALESDVTVLVLKYKSNK
ncbi:MAG: SpoIIE family protein phosphatase [Treponema sp.]|nr:SpoIIE family protein phosphatase [Treponema sp.]